MKTKELRAKNIEELKQMEQVLLKEKIDLRFAKVLSNVPNPSRFKSIRRSIAKIKTLIHEKTNKQQSKNATRETT